MKRSSSVDPPDFRSAHKRACASRNPIDEAQHRGSRDRRPSTYSSFFFLSQTPRTLDPNVEVPVSRINRTDRARRIPVTATMTNHRAGKKRRKPNFPLRECTRLRHSVYFPRTLGSFRSFTLFVSLRLFLTTICLFSLFPSAQLRFTETDYSPKRPFLLFFECKDVSRLMASR